MGSNPLLSKREAPTVQRTVVPRRVIDRLIREKLADVVDGVPVSVLPVVPRTPQDGECNWVVPGWVGDTKSVERSRERMHAYVCLLASQFDIANDG